MKIRYGERTEKNVAFGSLSHEAPNKINNRSVCVCGGGFNKGIMTWDEMSKVQIDSAIVCDDRGLLDGRLVNMSPLLVTQTKCSTRFEKKTSYSSVSVYY